MTHIELQELSLTTPTQGVGDPHCRGMERDEEGVKEKEVKMEVGVDEEEAEEEEELPYPTLRPVVFLCLGQTTRLRGWLIKIACSSWLDLVSSVMVLLNCVTLGMYNPIGEQVAHIKEMEAGLFTFFLLEMFIKMMALGVYGYEGSYLRNNWNKFDFFINSGELLDYFMAYLGFQLKVFQVVRPVRLISKVTSFRNLVGVLLDMAPMFYSVLALCFFVIHIFGVVGIQLWAGELRNRCYLGEDILTMYNVSMSPYYVSVLGERFPFICSAPGSSGMRHCSHVPPYSWDALCSLAAPHHALDPANGSDSTMLAGNGTCFNWNVYYNVCRAGDHNPYMGSISFDNIFYAWITIFQVITLEGWTEILFFAMDTYSPWVAILYFVTVTIMGSFIMMNVCAVVIATQFSESMDWKIGKQSGGIALVKRCCLRVLGWLQDVCCGHGRHSSRVHASQCYGQGTSVQERLYRPLKEKLKCIVDSVYFSRVTMFAVFLSIIPMVIEHHGQPQELTYVLEVSTIIFTLVFIMEMNIKLLAQWLDYFTDLNNLFDFAIVIVSLWELIAKAGSWLLVLRAFRLLRVVRLVHFIPHLKRQLLVLKRTMKEVVALCNLLLFFIFIFSILGMYLFGGKLRVTLDNGETMTDRKNFDTLLWSMITVFQILTQEDWNLVLYNSMASTSPWAALYFILLIVLGKLVLLNVVVGIVVQSFQEQCSSRPDSISFSVDAVSNFSSSPSASRESDAGPSRSTSTANEEERAPTDTNEDTRSLNRIQKVLRWCKEREDWSFYLLSPQNRFRACCKSVIAHKLFDHIVLLFILLSCITIAMERPDIGPQSMERWVLKMSGYVFSAVFLVEMLVKVLALGVFFGKESYCSSAWNVVDGTLVIISLLHIFISVVSIGDNNMLGMVKVFRLLRALRPLRVIKRTPKLKLAVEALMASVKPIGNIILISSVFFFLFGILGVQLFKGKFHHCVGPNIRNITNRMECLSANYSWERKQYNFDNMPEALLTLFVMYSKDGWVNLMYDGLDAVGVDKQPIRNYNQWMLIFFIPFMSMSIILLDMFIGVMVDTFHQCQLEQRHSDERLRLRGGGVQLDQLEVTEAEPPPYYTQFSPLRRSIHTLSTSKFLELFMNSIIFISVCMMALEHYNQPQYVNNLTEYSYYVFTVILTLEVLLKFVGYGILRFLRSSWNLLDLVVVLISIFSLILHEMKIAYMLPINPSILRVLRVLRLAQVLKAKKIRVLLKTIIKTLCQVGNICLLFMFFFFIYAALGVELFGKLECSEVYRCEGLNRYGNFRHFWRALLTLYQVCTGDNWSSMMKDTLRTCRPHDDSCRSYLSWLSPIYFSTFVIMAQFVLVNLVVAAIMQAQEDSNEMLVAERARLRQLERLSPDPEPDPEGSSPNTVPLKQ